MRGFAGGALARWSRKLVSFAALLASVAALALIVEAQYGQRLFDGTFGSAKASSQEQADAATLPAGEVASLTPAEEGRYRALSEYVAKRYRVSQEVAFDLVSLAHRVGTELQLDPLLIIAVISVESSFNPIAESVAGAKGLMQIIPKYHADKLQEFGGVQAVFDPETNIQVGAQILKEYIRITGHVGSALQMYAGALSDNDDQYTNKVLGIKQRLQYVAAQGARPGSTAAIRTAATRHSAFPLD